MKKNSLILLLVAAIALIALAVATQKSRRPAQGTSSTRIFKELPIAGINRIVVTSPDGSVTLAVKGERWVCTNAQDYVVQFDKLKKAVLKMEELKGQAVTADDARRDALKMNPPTSGRKKDTLGTLVELLGGDGKPLASLLLGEQRMRKPRGGPDSGYGGYPDGRYVSPDGGKTVFLVGEALDDFSGDAKSWLDTELTSLYSSDIRSIAIRHPGQPEIRLSKPEGKTTFEVEGLAADEETDDVKASSAAGALSYLRFDDVVGSSLSDEQAGMKEPVVFEAVATNGMVYTASVGGATKSGDSEARYLRLAVSLPAAQVDASDTNAVNARKEQEKKVADMNARFAGWTYVISSYKADSMTVKRDTIVKKKAKPATTNETASASSEVEKKVSMPVETTPAPVAPAPDTAAVEKGAVEAKAAEAPKAPETKIEEPAADKAPAGE